MTEIEFWGMVDVVAMIYMLRQLWQWNKRENARAEKARQEIMNRRRFRKILEETGR